MSLLTSSPCSVLRRGKCYRGMDNFFFEFIFKKIMRPCLVLVGVLYCSYIYVTYVFFLQIIIAAITPGTHPAMVSRTTNRMDPHPLSYTASGGNITHNIALPNPMFSLFLFRKRAVSLFKDVFFSRHKHAFKLHSSLFNLPHPPKTPFYFYLGIGCSK